MKVQRHFSQHLTECLERLFIRLQQPFDPRAFSRQTFVLVQQVGKQRLFVQTRDQTILD